MKPYDMAASFSKTAANLNQLGHISYLNLPSVIKQVSCFQLHTAKDCLAFNEVLMFHEQFHAVIRKLW